MLGPAELPLVTGELYEPDLFVVPVAFAGLRVKPSEPIRPLLICETLSPGSSRHDRLTKRRSFQRIDVPDYWIVDGDAEVFEVWHPADERPAIVDDRLTWIPTGSTVPFELDVREFFASVADGEGEP
jgi:Uma2 family endonuclease